MTGWSGSYYTKWVTAYRQTGKYKKAIPIRTVQTFQKEEQPVISVDTKKKELVGNFKNAGQEWQPQKTPESVRVYDFIDKELGKVSPYGVYDMTIP